MIDIHPAPEQLAAFRLGKLGDDELAEIESHVAQCDSCCRSLKSLPDDSFIHLVRQATDSTFAAESAAPISAADVGQKTWDQADTVTTGHEAKVPADLNDHPRYQIMEKLGQGGMGVVYKARHRLMERVVALKVLHPNLVNKQVSVERFQREVKGAARLIYPNIVTAYDADQAGASHFLVMEFVPGISLARLVEERGPLPVWQACAYIRQAALGLQHAFECGMVHRDIKPQNLMVMNVETGARSASEEEAPPSLARRAPKETVKILDFGLARFVSETVGEMPPGNENSDPDSRLTQASTVMGTPEFIAPEQAQSAAAADIRADIYSLGCTLYFLLAGHAPFPHGSALQKIKAHHEETPKPLGEIRTDVPVELVQVVERMLAKDPGQRFQTPAEVAEALVPLASGGRQPPVESASSQKDLTPTAGLRPPRARRRRLLIGLSLGLAAAVITLVIFRFAGGNREIIIETDDPDIEIVARGDDIIRIIDRKTGQEYQVDKQKRTLTSLNEKRNGVEVGIDFGPIYLKREGKRIAAVRVMSKARAHEELVWNRPIADVPILAVAVSPDGQWVAAAGGAWPSKAGWKFVDGDVRLIERRSGKVVRLLKGPKSHVIALAFSPDSKLVAAPGNADLQAYIWDVESGKLLHTLRGHKDCVTGVAFSRNGKTLVTTSWDHTLRAWDVQSGKEIQRFGAQLNVGWHVAAFLPGDSEVLAGGICPGDDGLFVFDWKKDKVVRTFKWPGARVVSLSLSPDSKQFLASAVEGTYGIKGNEGTRLWDVTSGKVIKEFATPRPATSLMFNVAFLPDGRRVITTGIPSGGIYPTGLAVWDVQTGKVLHTLKGHTDTVLGVAATPNGEYAVSGGMDQTVRLWKLPEPAYLTWPESDQLIANFNPPQQPITREGLAPTEEGGWRFDNKEPRNIRLFETDQAAAEDCLLVFRVKMKCNFVGEGSAYPVLGCTLPGDVAFSKTPDRWASGATAWTAYETSLRLEKGKKPSSLKLSLWASGKGTLWIKDLAVFKAPLPPEEKKKELRWDPTNLHFSRLKHARVRDVADAVNRWLKHNGWNRPDVSVGMSSDYLTNSLTVQIFCRDKSLSEEISKLVKRLDNPKADAEFLQGHWMLIKAEVNGQRIPQEMVDKAKPFKFSADRLRFSQNGNEYEGIFKLDPSKNPKWIDVKSVQGNGTVVFRGIYQFDFNARQLKLCLGGPGENRPGEFSAPKGTNVQYLTLGWIPQPIPKTTKLDFGVLKFARASEVADAINKWQRDNGWSRPDVTVAIVADKLKNTLKVEVTCSDQALADGISKLVEQLEKAAAPTPQKLQSGPRPGEQVKSFNPLHLNGPREGNKQSLVEEFGARPVALIFARSMSSPWLYSLATKINAEAKEAGRRSAVVFLDDKDSLVTDKRLLGWLADPKLKETILAVDNPAGPAGYKIHKDADVTVLLYVNKTVRFNFAFRKDELNEQGVAKIVEAWRSLTKKSALQPLFNGKDLGGWKGNAKDWKVEDKTLIFQGKQSSLLQTEKVFQNYVLRFEHWVEPRQGGQPPYLNLHLHYPTGDEIRDKDRDRPLVHFLADGAVHYGPRDYKLRPLTQLMKTMTKNHKKFGWNKVEVHSRGGELEIFVNGESVALMHPGKARRSPIALEPHWGEYSFRNVEIQVLPDDAKPSFQPLFNGKDLTGWEGDKDFCTWKDDRLVMKAGVKVKQRNVYLWTKRPYKNFEVRLEYYHETINGVVRVIPHGKVVPKDAARVHGTEALKIHWVGTLSGSQPHNKATAVSNQLGFNAVIITCKGKVATTVVNRDVIGEEKLQDSEGVLAFQLEGGGDQEAMFRNVWIRELPADDAKK